MPIPSGGPPAMARRASQSSPAKRIQAHATLDSPTKSASASVPISKAAFLSVKSSLSHNLESQAEFEWVLQNAGYNPSRELLRRYWTDNTESISFQEFDLITRTEPLPRKIDLLSYFKTFDPDNEGLIAHDTFIVAMTSKGRKLPMDVVAHLLDNPRHNRDGKLDYRTLVGEVFETSAHLAAELKRQAIEEDQRMVVNSGTYKVKRKVSSPVRKVAWNAMTKVRGAFYFEGDNIIAHQFNFQVEEEGIHELRIQPCCRKHIDCQIYIFKATDETGIGSPESKYKFIGCSSLNLTTGTQKNDADQGWSGSLVRGSYLIIPFTTGCKLKKRKTQPSSNISLVEPQGPGSLKLTQEFREVLSEIYHQVDLDSNGTLSRVEFNLFNWRTSGEEVQDEEWKVVSDNFDMKDGELTLDGFLQLHQMEAEDNGGDSAELWITLNAMGFNVGLIQDESAMFEITVKSEKKLPVQLSVSGLKSGGHILDKAVINSVLERSKSTMKVERAEDLFLYRQDSSICSSFLIQNRSNNAIKMQMDFEKSKNVLINHPHLNFRVSLSAKSTLIVAHLIPKDVHDDFSVLLQETVLK